MAMCPSSPGLNLTAHPGDIIGITGPVACGKSTLGRVFLCEAPYAGSVRFGKTELSALTPRQVSATVGYLGHDPELQRRHRAQQRALRRGAGRAAVPLGRSA